ncbi:phosphoesterase-domain-containing protein [Polychaeton citri CBS 116435]|uniref:Phosphoesterase-domain-containing protein n=1 Tax=Polychaeton citri CBS 116435 TaxID=1314669 RepID=A0A9P4Q956_9PEZI|nr:phosphoesterase-domain-containing protein [Polychaeton citri CBS 116435]
MKSFVLSSIAITGGVSQSQEPDINTATSASDVYAAQATAPTTSKTSHVKGKAFQRFITIWLENTDYDKAAGDPNMDWLASKGLLLENYFGVTHPSQPNYVASIGGDHFGMDNDAFNQIAGNVSSVIDLLEDKHISWSSYQEHMPYTGYEGFSWVNQETKANDYVRKHNPPVIYDANTTPERLANQKNLTLFYEDLENKQLPQWAFITPNMTNDGHDTSVTVAGQFVRSFLEPLLDNEYFWRDTLVLVTFDETHTYTKGNRVFSVLLGGAVPSHRVGTTDSNYYDHYSEIASVESNWNLHTLGRWDVGANVFSVVSDKTHESQVAWPEVTGDSPSEFLNSSYAGPFNEDFQWAPYPVPDIRAVSPHGFRTVLPKIAAQWFGAYQKFGTYYHTGVKIPDGQHPPKGYAVNDVDN